MKLGRRGFLGAIAAVTGAAAIVKPSEAAPHLPSIEMNGMRISAADGSELVVQSTGASWGANVVTADHGYAIPSESLVTLPGPVVPMNRLTDSLMVTGTLTWTGALLTFEAMQADCAARGCSLTRYYSERSTKIVYSHAGMHRSAYQADRALPHHDLVNEWRRSFHEPVS